MITVIFLICTLELQECFTQSPTVYFKSEQECQEYAATQAVLWTSNRALPPHSSTYKCLFWGKGV